MKEAILLLGSNLGNRELYLEKARLQINEKAGVIIKTSSLYESEPWGFNSENFFLNQAIKITTFLGPEELLKVLLQIEFSLGRIRTQIVSSRNIDIDILFYEKEVVNTENLIIPHPHIRQRMFTLLPLSEVEQFDKLPIFDETVQELIKNCNDKTKTYLYNHIKT